MQNNSPHHCRGDEGFTLIELLISLTIMTAIVVLLGGGIRILSRTSDAGTGRLDAMDMTARAFDLLSRDVAGIQRAVTVIDDKPRYIFVGQPDRLVMVVLEPPYPTDAGAYAISYQITTSGKATEVVRSRAPFDAAKPTALPSSDSEAVTLINGNRPYEFAYAEKSESSARWLRSWPSATRMPDLIRLQEIDPSTQTPVGFPMIVPLKTDAEITCLSDVESMCSPRNRGTLLSSLSESRSR